MHVYFFLYIRAETASPAVRERKILPRRVDNAAEFFRVQAGAADQHPAYPRYVKYFLCISGFD